MVRRGPTNTPWTYCEREKMKKLSKGILLDFGCGELKQGPHWTGMDKRKLPGVDIVHDLEKIPYPFEDESVMTCIASHVLEHLNPKLTIDIFNEMWRIMKVGGQWVIAVPYAGSHGYHQDPTHCNPFNETTFEYFDPEVNPVLYNIYKPKPWKLARCDYQVTGNMEVVLEKRGERGKQA